MLIVGVGFLVFEFETFNPDDSSGLNELLNRKSMIL
ncbi:MAG: hypothetical protein BWY67_00297 [Bacteroidetes bacterium ADurb.Bin397]|nr:MAG: hypothetical protein BWY67_00297 [Bacteroidetes bacterium ADurb.Bin397]